MSKKRIKQYLMLLTVVGLVAIAAGGGNGTFASFNAQVTNPGNTFASGTLFLHDTNGATTCTSESATGTQFNVNPGDGSNGNNCAILFPAVPFDGTAQTADLALNNAGSIDASALSFSVDGCSVGKNNNADPIFGGALTCGDLYITVQETDNSYSPAGDVYCAYGPTTNGTDCDTPDNTATLATAAGPSLTALNTTGATPADLAHGTTRYYVITIQPGSLAGNGNQWQNRKASFDLTWHIDQ